MQSILSQIEHMEGANFTLKGKISELETKNIAEVARTNAEVARTNEQIAIVKDKDGQIANLKEQLQMKNEQIARLDYDNMILKRE